MQRQRNSGHITTAGHHPRRALFVMITALMLMGGAGWLVPSDAAAGEVATVVTDGAPLFVDHDDHTVIEWMEAGTPVDFFYGPYEWMYQIRYYDTVGWTWTENIARDGGAAAWGGGGSGGGGGGSSADTSGGGERWIDVNRSNGAVTLYEGNTPLYVFWGSLSRSQGNDFYATASGTYYVYTKHRPLVYSPYPDNYFTHWVGFDPDRRNGFHSWVKDVNGTVVPNGAGFTAGCVSIPPGDIDVLFDFAYVGMRVEVHW